MSCLRTLEDHISEIFEIEIEKIKEHVLEIFEMKIEKLKELSTLEEIVRVSSKSVERIMKPSLKLSEK